MSIAPSLRHEHRQLTRNRIMEAARRLFYVRGYASTTMEEVAKAAAISRTTLYQHFSNRSLIMEAVLDEEAQRFRLILDMPKGQPIDRQWINRFLDQMQRHYRQNKEFVTILRQAAAVEETVSLRIDGMYRAVIDVMMGSLPTQRAKAAIPDELLRTRVYICLSATDSMLERCLLPEWKSDREVVMDELKSLWASMFDLR